MTTSETEKAPNTVAGATPRSAAIGAARMAGRYVEDAHATVCVSPRARVCLSTCSLLPFQAALHRLAPARHARLRFAAIHVRLEALLRLPVRGELFARLPEIDGKAGEVGRPERSRLQHLGAHDGHAQDVGLELHEQIVGGSAAVDAQLREALAGVLLHGVEHLRALVRDGLERGARDVGPRGATREADDCAARMR